MKKIIRLIITSCLLLSLFIPTVAFAAVNGEQADWNDIALSTEEFNVILASNTENSAVPYATGLINKCSIAISKSGNSLIIVGLTQGSTEVVKCGFTKVTIQRRANSSSSWSNYKTYTDLYIDGRIYNLSKSITVSSGYQYRVTCTHYAKKSLLSTQKIDNTSNTLTF